MKIFNKQILIILFFTITTVLFSQETTKSTTKKLTLSGSLDGYFRTNLNSYNRYFQDDESDAIAPSTSFANKPGFALGMANIKAEYKHQNVGAVIDLAAGPRGEDAISAEDGTTDLINQMYAYWSPSDKLTLTLGRFNTFLGYEVISPVDNFNYSTSYMFSYGPFSHTGLKADYQFSSNFSGMISIMNPTDVTSYNPYGTYTFGAQLGYTKNAGSTYLNVLIGDQDGKLKRDGNTIGDTSAGTTFQIDLTTGYDISSKLYLGFNTTYNSTEVGEIYTAAGIEDINNADNAGFWGAALYSQYKFSDKVSLGLRTEYFNEFEGGLGAIGLYDTNGDADVWDITLTSDISLGPLKVKPEIRYDFASEDVFAKDEDGSLQSSLGSALVAVVYQF